MLLSSEQLISPVNRKTDMSPAEVAREVLMAAMEARRLSALQGAEMGTDLEAEDTVSLSTRFLAVQSLGIAMSMGTCSSAP